MRTLPHVREIADNDVDPVHLIVRKHQSAIDDHHILVRLDHRHVAADLTTPAQRNDADVWSLRRARNHKGI